MTEVVAICDDRGAMLVSTARMATRRAASYAEQLAAHLSLKVGVEPMPGGFRVDFGFGEALVNYGADTLSLMVSADNGAALRNLRDALGVPLERFGRRDGMRVDWR